MKTSFRLFLLAAILARSFSANATHLYGGDIAYRYIGDSTNIPHHYEIIARWFLTPTSSTQPSPNQVIYVSSTCYGWDSIPVFPQGPMLASHSNTGCVSTFQEYKVARYKGYVQLPGVCSDFRFRTPAFCCRPNFDNIAGTPVVYFESLLDNTSGHNSSVRFFDDAMITLCSNVPTVKNFDYKNPDGDSLFFEFVNPKSGPNTNIPYLAGWSNAQPVRKVQGSYSSFNASNGEMHIQPGFLELLNVAMKITEYKYDSTIAMYRNVGYVHRDFGYYVTNNCNNTPVTNPSLSNLSISGIAPACCPNFININFGSSITANSVSANASEFGLFGPDNNLIPISSVEPYASGGSWYKADSLKINLLNPIYLNGTYHLRIKTGADGNTILNSCGYEYPDDSTSFEINKASYSNLNETEYELLKVEFYPNPAQNRLSVKTPANLHANSIKIMDVTGKVSLSMSTNIEYNEIDISSLSNGLYFIVVSNDSNLFYVDKLLIER